MAATITIRQTASTLPQKKGDPPNFGTVKSGRALAFDGVVDTLTLDDISGETSFADGESWTFACWVSFDIVNDDMYFTGNNGQTTPHIIFFDTDDCLGLRHTNGHYYRFGTDSLVADRWYRIVYTASSNTVTAYIDGAQYGVPITTSTAGSASNFTTTEATFPGSNMKFTGWGAPYYSGGARHHFLNGSMSDCQVWDAAWSATDVQNDYRHPEMLAHTFSDTSLTESNLKLWLPMTEGNPGSPQTTIFDGSPKGLGSEILANPNFDADSDWAKSGGAAITGGYGFLDDSPASSLKQTSVLTVGKVYYYTVVAKSADGGGTLKISDDGSTHVTESNVPTTYTTYAGYFTAVNTSFSMSEASSGDIYIDSASCKEVQRGNHATSVFYGTELLSNGEFTTNTTGWTDSANCDSSRVDSASDPGTASGGANNYVLKVVDDGGSAQVHSDAITVVIGKTYTLSYKYYRPSANTSDDGDIRINDNSDDSNMASKGFTVDNTWTSDSFDFVADHTSIDVHITADTTTGDILYFDSISLKETGLSTTGHVEGQETIFQPAFVGQSRKKVFGDQATNATFTEISLINNTASLSLWICPDNVSSKGVIIGTSTTASNIYILDSTSIQMEDEANSITLDWTVPTMSTGNWYHLAMVFNDDAGYSLYMNGSFVSTQDDDAFNGLDINRIGGAPGATDGSNFDGIIDEISYWTKELTLADVQEIYNDGVPLDLLTHSATSDLDNYWRNNNLHTDGTWKDLKGSNHVTFNATNDYEVIFPEGTTSGRDINGFFLTHPNKNYLSCDTNTYIDVPHSNVFDFGTGDITLECWAKASSARTGIYGAGLVIKQGNYNLNTAGYGLYWRQDNKTVTFNVGDGTDGAQVTSSALNLNQWYHIVGTYNGTTGRVDLYIDKSAIGNSTDATIDSINTSLDIEIGRSGAVYHDGFVDDVRIYGKVLSTDEIAKNYRHGSGKHKD